jgi:hypothetical protein
MHSVFAYIDPGSGSVLLQILLGGAAATAVGVKMSWRRLLRRFRVGKRDDKEVGAG